MKEVCRYDGSCHNAAPEHWVRFQHSKQSEARPLKRSLDEWLKDEEEHTPSSSSGCVLVPETPSPAQKTKMTARDLGEVMWNSKCVYAPVSEKKKGAIAASAKKQRVVGDELKSRRRDTDVSEALTPEILDRDDPKRSAEKKGKSVLASGSDSDEDVVRGVKAKQLAKNGLKPRKTMILESDSEDDGKLLGPGQISVGHDIDKEELQPACKKKKRALLLSDDDQDHDDTEPLLVKKGSDGNVVDLTSQQDTKWAESEVQHEMEEEYEEEDEEDVNEDVQEVVEVRLFSSSRTGISLSHSHPNIYGQSK